MDKFWIFFKVMLTSFDDGLCGVRDVRHVAKVSALSS